MNFKAVLVSFFVICASSPFELHAQSSINGLTYTYYFDGDFYPWQWGGIGGAQAGRLGSQTAYGHSEFDLAGQQAGTATLTFELTSAWEQETCCNLPPPISTISLGAYAGDNLAQLPGSPYPETFNVGNNEFGQKFASFAVTGLPIGQKFTYDVTSFYNKSLLNGDAALGIGLVGSTPIRTTYSFSNFVLTVTPPVPEPSTYALFAFGLASLILLRRARELRV
jgi:hypothetical protein